MKLGIVDLDTSHPQNWIPIERELGHEIVGVWDGGAVHPPSYVEGFAKSMEIPRIYSKLADMAPHVDCAIIHGCDWDTHLAKARPFIDAGKAVFIDKPLAGNPADLYQLVEWSKAGARITGGSSLRYGAELRAWQAKPLDQRGTAHTAICGCGVDEFNYGIHAYALLCGIMGPGIANVRHLGKSVQRTVQINWTDGRRGFVVIGAATTWLPFHATIITDKTVTQLQPGSDGMYRSLIEPALAALQTRGEPLTPVSELIEAELAAIAARRSWMEQDRTVELSELKGTEGFDGAAFATEYRAGKYPNGWPAQERA